VSDRNEQLGPEAGEIRVRKIFGVCTEKTNRAI
jgi:hypothetical protein